MLSRASNRIFVAVCLSGALAGCATAPATGVTTPTVDLQTVEADAILAAQALCAVTPTAVAITDIVIAGRANATTAAGMAQSAASAFCAGVTGSAPKTVKLYRLMTPRTLARGVVDYGVVVVNGRKVEVTGTPLS